MFYGNNRKYDYLFAFMSHPESQYLRLLARTCLYGRTGTKANEYAPHMAVTNKHVH